tara:strand:- start:2978 stop:4555 length:1578 start_codon:yes stop_codon:yes gene_type:complete
MVAPLALFLGSALGAGLLGKSQAQAQAKKDKQILDTQAQRLKRTVGLNDIRSSKTIELPDFTPGSSVDNMPDQTQIGGMNVGGGILGQRPMPIERKPRLLTSNQYVENPLISDFKADPQFRPVMLDIEKEILKGQLNPNKAQRSFRPAAKEYVNKSENDITFNGQIIEPGERVTLDLADPRIIDNLRNYPDLIQFREKEKSPTTTQITNQNYIYAQRELIERLKETDPQKAQQLQKDLEGFIASTKDAKTLQSERYSNIYNQMEEIAVDKGKDNPKYKRLQRKAMDFSIQAKTPNIDVLNYRADKKDIETQVEKLRVERALASDYRKLKGLLLNVGDGEIDTDKFAGIKLQVGQVLNGLGILPSSEIESLGAAEYFDALSKKVIPNLRVEGSGQQSNFETAFLRDAAPQLTKSKFGNLLIINGVLATQEYNQEYLDAKRAWIERNNTAFAKERGETFEQFANRTIRTPFQRLEIVQIDARGLTRDQLQAKVDELQEEGAIKAGQTVMYNFGGKRQQFAELEYEDE